MNLPAINFHAVQGYMIGSIGTWWDVGYMGYLGNPQTHWGTKNGISTMTDIDEHREYMGCMVCLDVYSYI